MVFLGGDSERVEKNRQALRESVLKEAIRGEIKNNQIEQAVIEVFVFNGDSFQQEKLRESLNDSSSDFFFVDLSRVFRGGVTIIDKLEPVLQFDHFSEIGVAIKFQ